MKKIQQIYLFDDWDRLKENIRGRNLFLFLDFDGTLSPIVATPELAVLPKETKNVLEKLTKLSTCQLAVVSGRALLDVRGRVGLKEVIYVGNHGFEIDGPGIHFTSLCAPDIRDLLEEIKQKLLVEIQPLAGVLIEDKGLTVSIHYRLVDPEHVFYLEQIFQKVTRPYERSKRIKTLFGKKVFEIRPPLVWDKGAAVNWLILHRGAATQNSVFIYVGDDATDEDAFRALQGKGITILVDEHAERPSLAYYFVRNPQEVTIFLNKVLESFHQPV